MISFPADWVAQQYQCWSINGHFFWGPCNWAEPLPLAPLSLKLSRWSLRTPLPSKDLRSCVQLIAGFLSLKREMWATTRNTFGLETKNAWACLHLSKFVVFFYILQHGTYYLYSNYIYILVIYLSMAPFIKIIPPQRKQPHSPWLHQKTPSAPPVVSATSPRSSPGRLAPERSQPSSWRRCPPGNESILLMATRNPVNSPVEVGKWSSIIYQGLIHPRWRKCYRARSLTACPWKWMAGRQAFPL